MNPISLLIELTNVCNQHCIYCYHAESDRMELKSLEVAQWIAIIHGIQREYLVDSVTLMGGEPLLYAGVNKLIQELRRSGIFVGIASNGSLLNKNNINEMKDAGLNSIEISMNSINPVHLNQLNSWSNLTQMKKNLIEIKKNGLFLSVNMILTKINENDLKELVEFCSVFSVNRILLSPMIPEGGGKENQKMRLNDHELSCALENANELSFRYAIEIFFGYPYPICQINPEDYPGIRFGTCVCGDSKWLIDSSGFLKTCEYSNEKIGNLKNNSLSQLLNGVIKLDALRNQCLNCSNLNRCNPCMYL